MSSDFVPKVNQLPCQSYQKIPVRLYYQLIEGQLGLLPYIYIIICAA